MYTQRDEENKKKIYQNDVYLWKSNNTFKMT